jgi:hypothetical protein
VKYFVRDLGKKPLAKRLVIANGPFVIFATVVIVIQAANTSARSSFERLVAKPIPKSVHNLQQGGIRTMDSVFWVLRFEIGSEGLTNLLNKIQFSGPQKEVDWASWNRNLQ